MAICELLEKEGEVSLFRIRGLVKPEDENTIEEKIIAAIDSSSAVLIDLHYAQINTTASLGALVRFYLHSRAKYKDDKDKRIAFYRPEHKLYELMERTGLKTVLPLYAFKDHMMKEIPMLEPARQAIDKHFLF